jgi:hypothetical protein
MIYGILRSRMILLGRVLLFCCIMAGLSAAQENTSDCVRTGAALGSYANLTWCLPDEVVVAPEGMGVINYSSGTEVAASMMVDENRIELHLIYPCQAPQIELEPAELKPYLEAYDPVFAQATYNESVISPILVGQIGNLKFIAFQRHQTIFLVMTDMNTSDSIWQQFLGDLTLQEGVASASNCPGSASPETTSAASEVEEEVAAALEPVQENETATVSPSQPATVETTKKTLATGKDKMAADMAAAQAKMDELMGRK